ncbi:hypothetical protein pb186bvf_018903 [Paramecium bursaria]
MKAPRYPKFQYQYSKDDYPYNLQYKKSDEEQIEEKKLQDYYVEIIPGEYRQLTRETCLQILDAKKNNLERVFVRLNDTGGHCINIKQMTLINLLTQKARQITQKPKEGSKIIKIKLNLNPKLPPQPIQKSMFHWMEYINNQYVPLQLSINDHIERCYELYQQKKCPGVLEFTWQQYRYILDLRNLTLQNSDDLEITRIQRQCLSHDEMQGRIAQQNILEQDQNDSQYQKDSKELSIKVKNADEEDDEEVEEQTEQFDWQYLQSDMGSRGQNWSSYDEENQQRLEKQYKKFMNDPKMAQSFKIKKGTSKNYVDFIKMIEYSPLTKKSKLIRRIILSDEQEEA